MIWSFIKYSDIFNGHAFGYNSNNKHYSSDTEVCMSVSNFYLFIFLLREKSMLKDTNVPVNKLPIWKKIELHMTLHCSSVYCLKNML